jgi:hypothetical protein
MASDRGVEAGHDGRIMVGRVLVEALMRPVIVEMAHILVNDGAGVSLVVDQQPVGALLANAADKPFGIAVRLRCLGRNLDHIEAFGGEDGIEGGGELGVPVADQEAERGDPLTHVHHQITGGLGSPGRGRMSGHPEQVQPAGADLHDEQNIEPAQRDGVEGEEVGGEQARCLSTQEGLPSGVCSAWWGPEAGSGQDAADRARAQAMSKPDQFALDAAVTPGRILLRQAQHQIADLVTERRAAGLVWIGPLLGDQAAVPGQQRAGGNDAVDA